MAALRWETIRVSFDRIAGTQLLPEQEGRSFGDFSELTRSSSRDAVAARKLQSVVRGVGVRLRLADSELGEVFEFFASREEAEEALRDVLTDEPDWKGIIGVAEIDLGSASPN
jgi:hypothetical protein